MLNVIIRILGIVGIITGVLAYQLKTHKKIMVMRSVSESLFGIQYILLAAYTGAGLNFIGVVRNLVFGYQVEKKKSTVLSRILFCIAFAVVVIFSWEGPKSILIGTAKLISTIAFGCRNTVLIRIFAFTTSTMWLIYNLTVASYEGALCEAFTIISLIVALVRIAVKKSREKKENSASDTNA